MKTVLKFHVTHVDAIRKEQDKANHIHLTLALNVVGEPCKVDNPCMHEVHYTHTALYGTSAEGTFGNLRSDLTDWLSAHPGACDTLRGRLDEIAERYLLMLERVDEAIHEDGPGTGIKPKPERVEVWFENKNPKQYEIIEDVSYTVQRAGEEPVGVGADA